MESLSELQIKILKLKKEKNALILAHYYVPLDVQDIADYVCDSFEMAKRAKNASEKTDCHMRCAFLWVKVQRFYHRKKKVLIPAPDAGLPHGRHGNRRRCTKTQKRTPWGSGHVLCQFFRLSKSSVRYLLHLFFGFAGCKFTEGRRNHFRTGCSSSRIYGGKNAAKEICISYWILPDAS